MTVQEHETPLAGEVSQNTQKNTDAQIFAQFVPDRKALETARARLLMLGRTLTVSRRAGDGRHTWTICRWGQCRHRSHWNDVLALLTQLEDAR